VLAFLFFVFWFFYFYIYILARPSAWLFSQEYVLRQREKNRFFHSIHSSAPESATKKSAHASIALTAHKKPQNSVMALEFVLGMH
jgi:hypothetical protein